MAVQNKLSLSKKDSQRLKKSGKESDSDQSAKSYLSALDESPYEGVEEFKWREYEDNSQLDESRSAVRKGKKIAESSLE